MAEKNYLAGVVGIKKETTKRTDGEELEDKVVYSDTDTLVLSFLCFYFDFCFVLVKCL